jgi:uroporphyrinogen-III synthase
MALIETPRDGLAGIRVGLLEARMSGEMAELVRRYGGDARSAPAVSEAPIDCAGVVAELLDRLERPARRVFIFLTGVGAAALFAEANRQERLSFLLESLNTATIVCRGPKPAAALRRYGLTPTLSAKDPYTSRELLDAVAAMDLTDADVTLVHYGERSEPLAEALRARGAMLNELCLYEWRLPSDIEPLKELIRAIVARDVDAVIFTSQIQWRHLVQVAAAMGLMEAVSEAFKSDVVVASVGPVCTEALQASGIEPHVVPASPKMGPLVAALAEHFKDVKR